MGFPEFRAGHGVLGVILGGLANNDSPRGRRAPAINTEGASDPRRSVPQTVPDEDHPPLGDYSLRKPTEWSPVWFRSLSPREKNEMRISDLDGYFTPSTTNRSDNILE